METDETAPVLSRAQRTYRVEGPWRGGPRTLVVAEGLVVASDHKPWLGFEWAALLPRITRAGVVIRRIEPLIDRTGRTPMWLSLEEMIVLKKALQYILDPQQSERLDEGESALAVETLAELKRVMGDVQVRMIRDAYSQAVTRREAWGAEEPDGPVD